MWGHRYHVSEQGIVHTSDGPQAFVSLCCHPGKSDANGGDFALCLEVDAGLRQMPFLHLLM